MSTQALKKILIFIVCFFAIGVVFHAMGTGTILSPVPISDDNNSNYEGTIDQTDPEVIETSSPESITYEEDKEFGYSADNLIIDYIDTGNSDCILVRLDDKVFLIDAGDIDDGDAIVKYLENEGVMSIDALILTHPHADHIGGALEIIDNYPIEKVYMPKIHDEYVPTTRTYKNLLQALVSENIPVESPNVGTSISNGANYDFFFLNSSNSDNDWQKSDLNNYSLVTYLVFGNHKYIFCGDATKRNEDIIMSSWPDLDLDVEVLKAGHHCSKTSSSEKWIQKTKPEHAICLVEKGNDYNHPHEIILNRFQKYNINVYRSDFDKTIRIYDNGEEYKIEQGLPSANGLPKEH